MTSLGLFGGTRVRKPSTGAHRHSPRPLTGAVTSCERAPWQAAVPSPAHWMGSTSDASKRHEVEPRHVSVPTRASRCTAKGGETRERRL
jgi:hypothetical protein